MKFLLFSTSLLLCLFSTSAFGQSVGQSCSVNGRTQMSATASEGLIQCRSGTWASASQTVSSGGSSTPITAIMQYEKTLVTTVDACTDAMVGFKGFNPNSGRTMVCAGSRFGWKHEISPEMSTQQRCSLVTPDSVVSFSRVDLSSCQADTVPKWCVFVEPRVLFNGNQRLIQYSFQAAEAFCRQLGFSKVQYSNGCGSLNSAQTTAYAQWNGSNWVDVSAGWSDVFTGFIGCLE